MTLCGLAGAVALLGGVALSGAGLVRAQRAAHTAELLEARYGEPFTVERVYGRSNIVGYELWPFILLEDYYTAAAHSNAYPEMLVRVDVNVRDDKFWDNYAAQRISRNTEAYLTEECLEGMPDGKWYFTVGLADTVGWGRPLEAEKTSADHAGASGDAGSAGVEKDPSYGGRFAALTGLALHELEAEAVRPSAVIYVSPASGTADADALYEASDRILDYFVSCAPEDPASVTVYLITKPSGVEQVRAYLTGNRIGNYSTLEYFAAMEPAVCATLEYSPKEKTRTPREEFVFEPLYPGMRGDTVKIN